MIKCASYLCGNPIDGEYYECGYEKAPDDCDDCILTGGDVSPKTGGKFRGDRLPYKVMATLRLLNRFTPEQIVMQLKEILEEG